MEVSAIITETGTAVVVSGDYDVDFSLETIEEDEIIAEVAAELGLSIEEVEDIITIVNNIGKPKIIVREVGGEIVRVSVEYEGIETDFVLGIIDPSATYKEIWKRTGINQSIVEDVVVWIVE